MDIIQKSTSTLRILAAETITNANSGHGGIALGAAPLLYAAYKNMNFDNQNPSYFNRDRFVLSAGHGSALLYATLHLFGFPVSRDDLKTFRKFGSALHGHPEVNEEKGIDASTGPLGQGVATSVGLALAEKKLSATFNRPGYEIINHYTYCVAGDGCLMEGVAYEAINLAGLWKLNKLIMLYDSNQITLDGTRASADAEDVVLRFKSVGWNVIDVQNANDSQSIINAIIAAKQSPDAPTVVICNTTIGYGSHVKGTSKAHGVVLSKDETLALRKEWGLDLGFLSVDIDVAKHFETLAKENQGADSSWRIKLESSKAEYTKEYNELLEFVNAKRKYEGEDLTPVINNLSKFNLSLTTKSLAIRDFGNQFLTQLSTQSPRLFGGSADVASTTKAFISPLNLFSNDNPQGTDIAFGVREHAMAAICNGLALHGFSAYCSTFLAFSDYARPSIRMSALMGAPVHYIFTHDGLGNTPDGPTHQCSEHITALRLIPNMTVFRPCDELETAASFNYIYSQNIPATSILSRGGAQTLTNEFADITATQRMELASKGGYTLSKSLANNNMPTARILIVATGTEVALALQAQQILAKENIATNVVSMPCPQLFDYQSEEYKSQVLCKDQNGNSMFPTLIIEMAHSAYWHKYLGTNPKSKILGFDTFGFSGSDADVLQHLGFTVENVVELVKSMI